MVRDPVGSIEVIDIHEPAMILITLEDDMAAVRRGHWFDPTTTTHEPAEGGTARQQI